MRLMRTKGLAFDSNSSNARPDTSNVFLNTVIVSWYKLHVLLRTVCGAKPTHSPGYRHEHFECFLGEHTQAQQKHGVHGYFRTSSQLNPHRHPADFPIISKHVYEGIVQVPSRFRNVRKFAGKPIVTQLWPSAPLEGSGSRDDSVIHNCIGIRGDFLPSFVQGFAEIESPEEIGEVDEQGVERPTLTRACSSTKSKADCTFMVVQRV